MYTFAKWLFSHFALRNLFTPFATINRAYRQDGLLSISCLGFTDYYVFGVRVARIQKTKPWSKEDENV